MRHFPVFPINNRTLSLLICFLLSLCPASPAVASLMGDEITADAVWQNAPGGPRPLLTGATAIADPVLVEFDVPIPGLGGSGFSIDFFADNTFIIVFDPADFTVWPIDLDIEISDLDFLPAAEITGVTQTSSNASGFLDVISFGANSISITSSAPTGAGATFTAEFAFTTSATGGNTPAGTDVVVIPIDQTTSTTPMTLTFGEVTTGGETTLASAASGPPVPDGYAVCEPATWYQVWTTAITAPSSAIEVCLDIDGLDCSLGPPALFYWDGSTWTDVTSGTSATEVCGVVDDLGTFALLTPNVTEPCVTIRRSLTGEQPNALSVAFESGGGPGAVMTSLEFNLGAGHWVQPTTGIPCIPNNHDWFGAGTATARIEFDPPIASGTGYTECIADDMGFYWDSGQHVTVHLSTYSGSLSYTVPFDHFYDIVTTKTVKVSEATVGCTVPQPLGFTFDAGDAEGWTMEGAYRETGGDPVSSNFAFLWEDTVDYPGAIGANPAGDEVGSIAIWTPGGHGVPSAGNSWWIMRFYSPDLSAHPVWQNASGFSVKVGEAMAATSTLYANLFVVVYDFDTGQDRYFYNGNAAPLTLDDWTSFSFDWGSISTFPAHYEIRNVFVNLWGTMTGTYSGGVYLDDVVPTVPAPTAAQPPDSVRRSFVLHPPSPNPFNPQTTLRFDLGYAAQVSLEVYNVAGRRVRQLLDGVPFDAGTHHEIWDGRDAAGRLVASGNYIARMEVDGVVQVRRMVLLK